MEGTVKEALKVLSMLEGTSKRTEKEDLLCKYAKNKNLHKIFSIAYQPGVTYGVKVNPNPKKYKESKIITPTKAMSDFETLVAALKTRKISGGESDKAVKKFLCSVPLKFRVWAIRALNRNLRIGVNAATFGQFWKDLVSDFGVPTYKVGTIDDDSEFPEHDEPKMDGYNFSFIFPGKKYPVSFAEGQEKLCLSRGQLHYPMLEKFWDKIKKHIEPDHFVIAEAYAKWSKDERLIYKGPWSKASTLIRTGMTDTGFKPELITKEHRKLFDSDFQLLIFEYGSNKVYSSKYGYTDPMPRRKRRKRLVDLVKRINDPQILAMPCVTLHNKKEVEAYYQECLNNGFEGIMRKKLNAGIRLKRTDDCTKLKPEEAMDGIILGIYKGTGKNAKWGGGMQVYLPKYKAITNCNLRTDKDRYEFWKNRDSLIGVQAEFKKQKEPKDSAISVSRFIVFQKLREDLPRIPAPKCALWLSKYSK